jgi:tetratricopeptide (TPR) repeat protein
MDAILKPLEQVNEALSWFLAAAEQRLLYIQASDALRIPILQLLAGIEGQRRCRSPVVILEAGAGDDERDGSRDSDDDDGGGWATRTEELFEEMAAARARAAAADPPLEVSAMPAPEPIAPPLAGFARGLKMALACVQPPLSGLLVVLAPVWVTDAAAWREALAALVPRPELAGARFVVIDPEDAPARSVAVQLGRLAEIADGRVDARAAAAGLSAMVAGMASAPAGASAARAAGLAGPREAPPTRRNAPPVPTAEQQSAALAEVGLPPAYGDPVLMQQVRVAVMTAAHELAGGRVAEAVRLQREARDLCERAGLAREATLFEIVMGSYALQGGAPEQAIQAFASAAARAVAAGLSELAAQAHLARGGALLMRQRPADAAIAYAEAGHLASAKLPAIAIEGYRMAGTLLLSLHQEQAAVAIWRRALAVADEAPSAERAATTAPEVARALAAVCRRRGLRAQADALEAQAERLEQPPAAAESVETAIGAAAATDATAATATAAPAERDAS